MQRILWKKMFLLSLRECLKNNCFIYLFIVIFQVGLLFERAACCRWLFMFKLHQQSLMYFFENYLVKLSLISPIKGRNTFIILLYPFKINRLDNDDNDNNNQVLVEVKGENWYHYQKSKKWQILFSFLSYITFSHFFHAIAEINYETMSKY